MSFSHTEAWLGALQDTILSGARSEPRGMATRELTWQELRVRDPMSFPLEVYGREFRDVIAVLEALSLVGEFSVPELFTDRVKKFAQFMDHGVFWGSYGARAHGAFGNIVDLLKRDPDSRQAVLTLYDSRRDLNTAKADIPCTIALQFLLRERRDGPEAEDRNRYLSMGVTMRSNDLWLGTPYDLVQFSILQASLAQALGVRVGEYVHRVGSLHIYERDIEKAAGITFRGGPSMQYPLWAVGTPADLQSRARRLALGQLEPVTKFERWADGLLRG